MLKLKVYHDDLMHYKLILGSLFMFFLSKSGWYIEYSNIFTMSLLEMWN